MDLFCGLWQLKKKTLQVPSDLHQLALVLQISIATDGVKQD